MSTKWKWLTDETWHWKGHVVDDVLAHDIQMELFDRAFEAGHSPTFVMVDQTDYVYFDMPGMCLIERAHRDIDLDGLTIRIPSQDFEDIYAQVKLLPERTLLANPDLKYYKLHGWRFCIVLLASQRDALIEAMEAQRAAAEVEAAVDNGRFVKGLEGLPVVSARAEMLKKAAAGNEGAN